MAIFQTLLIVLQVLSAIAVIILVLLQQGKGADMGAAFGSGTSGSLFGASGSANFLSRSTAICATLFFVCTLGLSSLSRPVQKTGGGVMESVSPTMPANVGQNQPGVNSTDNAVKPAVPVNPVQDIPK